MNMYVNNLKEEKWSSEIDRISIEQANAYEIKCYHNRYYLAYEKGVKPAGFGRVLDIATGTGAGAAYIAERMKSAPLDQNISNEVLGVDISQEGIDEAILKYNKYATFICKDMLTYMKDVPDDYFNTIISMETIEHIDKITMCEFLPKVQQKLKPGGRAVFSCPRLRPRESTKKRPGHINELYYSEFKYTLGEYFPMVEFYAFDRYGNIVPDYPECNLIVGVCHKWHNTLIF